MIFFTQFRRASLLLPAHGAAVEERAPGHEEHDENGDADSTQHSSGNHRGKAIHRLVLKGHLQVAAWSREMGAPRGSS